VGQAAQPRDRNEGIIAPVVAPVGVAAHQLAVHDHEVSLAAVAHVARSTAQLVRLVTGAELAVVFVVFVVFAAGLVI
jgi:hypothetical protein